MTLEQIRTYVVIYVAAIQTAQLTILIHNAL